MWNWYAEEKLHEFREEDLERSARRRAGLVSVKAKPRHAIADMIGQALIRWGTRMQRWAEQPESRDSVLAGAQE